MSRLYQVPRWSILPLFVAALVAAYIYGGWPGPILLSCVALPVAAYFEGKQQFSAPHRAPTYGRVLVDTPEIYTRERLVNDRFREDKWLRERLADTDAQTFGVQGARSRREFDSNRIEARVGPEGEKPPTPPKGPNQDPAIVPLKLPETSGSPVDQFRDLLAYREEVRNEIIQNQLDDRHDLNGNTLYRCKFDVTVLPGDNTQASAFVEVTIKGPFPKKLDEGYKPVKAGYVQVDSDSAIPAACESSSENIRIIDKALGVDATRGGDDHSGVSRLVTLYEQWVEYIRNDLRTRLKSGLDNELLEPYLRKRVLEWYDGRSGLSGSGLLRAVNEACETRSETTRIDVYFGLLADPSNEFLKEVGYRAEDYGHPPFYPETSTIEELVVEFHIEGVAKGLKDYVSIYRNANSEVEVNEPFLTVMAFDTRNQLREKFTSLVDGNEPTSNPFVITDSGFESSHDSNPDNKVWGRIEIRTGLMAFIKRLVDSSTSTYTYAVTPKESAQRISELSAGEKSLQAMLAVSANAGAADLKSTISQLKHREALMGAITRQPLIVGFGRGKPADEAAFGWILGPRFEVPDQPDSSVGFRHVPAQHALAAIISAPAWWSRMEVSIVTTWLDEQGRSFDPAGPDTRGTSREEQRFSVSLPGSARDLNDLLFQGKTNIKQPEIIESEMEEIHVFAGTTASILIPGIHLWRSTVVTIGGQQATGITVMPNMNGIIATFGPIDTSVRLGDKETMTLPLTVWTSEGKASVKNKVFVHQSASGPTLDLKELTPQSRGAPRGGQQGTGDRQVGSGAPATEPTET